jgi:hypothetical protein
MAAGTGRAMPAEARLPARKPGISVPGPVREAAARAGRRAGRRLDPALLRRVRDALVRLPDSAVGRHYIAILGECLASPRAEGQ